MKKRRSINFEDSTPLGLVDAVFKLVLTVPYGIRRGFAL